MKNYLPKDLNDGTEVVLEKFNGYGSNEKALNEMKEFLGKSHVLVMHPEFGEAVKECLVFKYKNWDKLQDYARKNKYRLCLLLENKYPVEMVGVKLYDE